MIKKEPRTYDDKVYEIMEEEGLTNKEISPEVFDSIKKRLETLDASDFPDVQRWSFTIPDDWSEEDKVALATLAQNYINNVHTSKSSPDLVSQMIYTTYRLYDHLSIKEAFPIRPLSGPVGVCYSNPENSEAAKGVEVRAMSNRLRFLSEDKDKSEHVWKKDIKSEVFNRLLGGDSNQSLEDLVFEPLSNGIDHSILTSVITSDDTRVTTWTDFNPEDHDSSDFQTAIIPDNLPEDHTLSKISDNTVSLPGKAVKFPDSVCKKDEEVSEKDMNDNKYSKFGFLVKTNPDNRYSDTFVSPYQLVQRTPVYFNPEHTDEMISFRTRYGLNVAPGKVVAVRLK